MARQTWFSDVLRALADVEYVLVGGLATVAHGYVRATQDVDLVVELGAENALRAVEALGGIGYSPRVPVSASQFADPATRERWRSEKNLAVFPMIHRDPARPTVDLFVAYPLPWDRLRDDAVTLSVGDAEARVCSLDHLIEIKQAAGRPRDLADVEQLRIVREARPTTGGTMNGFLPHIADPAERKRATDAAFAAHEREQLLDLLHRTTAEDRIYMAGELVLAFPDQLEAGRIRDGVYGERIPQALLDDPPPLVREALVAVGRLPRE